MSADAVAVGREAADTVVTLRRLLVWIVLRGAVGLLVELLLLGCHSALEIWGHDHVFTGPGMPPSRAQVPVRLGQRTIYLDRFFDRREALRAADFPFCDLRQFLLQRRPHDLAGPARTPRAAYLVTSASLRPSSIAST